MAFLRLHPAPTAIVVAAVAATGAVFAFARPAYHPHVEPKPSDHGLSYTRVRWTAADAERAFAAEHVRLVARARLRFVTDLSDPTQTVEVSVFGDRTLVEGSGFYDYTTDAGGRYVRFARRCGAGTSDAERWRGNVRAIVSCDRAGGGADAWLRRVDRALAQLG